MRNMFNLKSTPAFDLTPRAQAAAEFLKSVGVIFKATGHDSLEARSIDLSHRNMSQLPDLSMVTVDGHFDIRWNLLTSLKGAPCRVTRSFACDHNLLVSLEDAPAYVGGNFTCANNSLQLHPPAPALPSGPVLPG